MLERDATVARQSDASGSRGGKRVPLGASASFPVRAPLASSSSAGRVGDTKSGKTRTSGSIAVFVDGVDEPEAEEESRMHLQVRAERVKENRSKVLKMGETIIPQSNISTRMVPTIQPFRDIDEGETTRDGSCPESEVRRGCVKRAIPWALLTSPYLRFHRQANRKLIRHR